MLIHISHSFSRAITCVFLLIISSSLFAAPPSAAQIDQFIEIARVQQKYNSFLINLEEITLKKINRIKIDLQQQNLSTEQQQQIDSTIDSIITQFRQEMSWQQMEPLYRQAYVRYFDSDDFQVLLDFNLSPARQAYLDVAEKVTHDPALRGNMTAMEQAMKEELSKRLSVSEWNTIHEFQTSAIGQRVLQKMDQAHSEVSDLLLQQLDSVEQQAITEIELIGKK